MSNIYFHIGYPKSASTTLQKQCFNKHNEIINLGLYPTNNVGLDTEKIDENSYYISDKNVKLFYDNLLKKDEISYQFTKNHLLLDDLLNKYQDKNKAIVFSEERITSVFFTHPDIGLKANRIKKLIPNAKIIIVIRNQVDALTSMYADFPFDPRSFSIGKPIDIDKWVDTVLDNEFIYYREMLNYFNVIEHYSDLFGVENICILLFEELINKKDEFSNKLSHFMNINRSETLKLLSDKHENKRVSHRFNIARSLKNKYIPYISIRSILGNNVVDKLISFLKEGSSKKYKMNSKTREKVYNYYMNCNTQLSEKYDLNVKYYNKEFWDES